MRTARALVPALLALTLLTGCFATSAPDPSEHPTQHPTATQTEQPTLSPTPPTPTTPQTSETPPVAAQLDCDNMLDPAVAAAYRAEGLAPYPKPFEMGHGIALDGGLSCAWGLADAPAGEAAFVYSWAPLTDVRAETVIADLQAQEPFAVEPGDGGTYLTASYPGVVFFVTDRSIRFADSREAMRDIVWTG